MDSAILDKIINELFIVLEDEIAGFRDSHDDWRISEGHVAICIITTDGKIYGKVFGSDKIKQRKFFSIAWQKASQVWITGYKTGDYEKIVFGGGMNPEDSPISLPDLIGWVGGQPIQLDQDTTLAVGFSGFRGFNDIDIVQRALKRVLKNIE
jgi:glc operon protein GlcG